MQAEDKNTSFLHNSGKTRVINNNIEKIIGEDGQEIKGQEEIKNEVFRHFKTLLSAVDSQENPEEFLKHIPKVIDMETNNFLTKEVTEEVKAIVWDLQLDKASGPDGFPIAFYDTFWHLIKNYLMKMIRYVIRKKKIGGFTNCTFLSLIPKDPRPSSLNRFRPISLCNSSYKIISKIIASRLKPLLPSLISENQGIFFPNRQIVHNIILVQEALHTSLSRNEKGFILKMDMVNAFDRVNLSFLTSILKRFGFSDDIVNLIQACTTGPWIAPHVNGRPCEFF